MVKAAITPAAAVDRRPELFDPLCAIVSPIRCLYDAVRAVVHEFNSIPRCDV